MRIIRPYGESQVEARKDERILVRNTLTRKRENIEEFASTHDELVIAQWISTIDKIATKPSGKTGATKRQREFRERLGKTAMEFFRREGILQGLASQRAQYLTELWAFKIHPYGRQQYRTRRIRGKEVPEPDPRGRLYRRYTSSPTPETADAEEIIRRVYEHLHKHEYLNRDGLKKETRGRIERRAHSISKNVLQRKRVVIEAPQTSGDPHLGWSSVDEKTYSKSNVAGTILGAALARERKNRRVTADIAGKALFEHWAAVFQRDGAVLTIKDAQNDPEFAGMYELHNAVRAAYAQILKRHKKDMPEHRKGRAKRARRRISTLLPSDMDGLFKKMRDSRRNRSLSDLVRLGKVLHYSEAELGEQSVRDPGHYWTSAGQSEIKRSEAFVRSWRNAISLASRTIKDWADPDDAWAAQQDSDSKDILSSARDIGQTILPDSAWVENKLYLLFGERKDDLPLGVNAQLQTLRQIALDTAKLRNLVFHFKSREKFTIGLEELGQSGRGENDQPLTDPLISADQKLWEKDCKKQHSVFVAALAAADIPSYAKESQAAHLVKEISGAQDSHLPLPRFSRLLTRVKNAWNSEKGEKPKLPVPVDRGQLEMPGRHCQYVAQKLLYERPFRSWLERQEGAVVGAWIDTAINRSTTAARKANVKEGEVGYSVTRSRAAALRSLGKDAKIDSFFFDLTAATASEMRVQRGYQSDAESAREQAAYIDDLKCDVVALAFSTYLENNGFDWLQTLDTEQMSTGAAPYRVEDLDVDNPDASGKPWQWRLYVLLHLIPVDEIGRLKHQLDRWEITSDLEDDYPPDEKERLHALRRVLILYMDMHDAKFSGAAALAGCDTFRALFDSDNTFGKVFPHNDETKESRVPRRGLREIARFSNAMKLASLFSDTKITGEEIEKLTAFESAEPGAKKSKIAELQAEREDLHKAWTQSRRAGLSTAKMVRYIELIKLIGVHRRLSNRINLIDHVRAHQLVMAVIGRLIDYAGLFERDLQFVTRAILHDLGQQPEDVFLTGGLRSFRNGQILDALTKMKKSNDYEIELKDKILARIGEHFTDVDNPGNTVRRSRNYIAHLNMLAPGEELNLTGLVNRTREMMSYDRKLKNAVSQSIRELLLREGFDLIWEMDANQHPHSLINPRVQVRTAIHLGGTKLYEKASDRQGKPRGYSIYEALYNPALTKAVASIFKGEVDQVYDISTLDLSKIDMDTFDRKVENAKHRTGGNKGPQRPRGNGHDKHRRKRPAKPIGSKS